MEHGLLQALGAIADHWEALNDMKVQLMLANDDVDAAAAAEDVSSVVAIDSWFEYWMLMCGCVAAGLVFGGELLVHRLMGRGGT